MLNYRSSERVGSEPTDRSSKARNSSCNADDITSKAIGDFGPWQLRICVLMSLLKLPMAWFQLNIIFMAPPQDFWCKKPDFLSFYSDEEWRDMSKPHIEEYPCLIFDPDTIYMVPALDRSHIPLVECKTFIYNTSIFKRTIVSEWDLVCSKHWLIHITQCVMMWGVLLGGVIFGIIADKQGRIMPLMLAIIIQVIASYMCSFIRWFWSWLAFWFVLALASGGLGTISFVVCMEAVNGKWRTTIPVLYQLPFGLGSAIMSGLAYIVRDWRKLEFALASLSTLFILYWFWILESPRWLLATGQTDKALEILKKITEFNKTEMKLKGIEHLASHCTGQKTEGPGFTAFFKLKNMRQKTILLSANWFFIGLQFFAFSQYLGLIGGNIFITVAVSGLIYVPGPLLCLIVLRKVGRRPTLWIFQFLSGLCFVAIMILPKDNSSYDWIRLVIAGIGYSGIGAIVPTFYLYTGELFPTLGRNAGVGGVTIFARVAAMIAPFVVSLDEILPNLMLILLAISSLLQIFLTVPLPETKDYPLPDTIEQAEQFTRKTELNNYREPKIPK